MDKQLTTVYITKYALSIGVIKREGEVSESGSIRYRDPVHRGLLWAWHADYRFTETEALEKA